MRIVHLNSCSVYSGPLPSTVGLALAQRRQGHEVYLYWDRKHDGFSGYEESAGVPLRFAGLDDPQQPLTLSSRSTAVELIRDLWRLRAMLRAGAFDVVHLHRSHEHVLAALAAWGLRPRRRPRSSLYVRTFHSERALENRLARGWFSRQADRWITRCEDHHRMAVQYFRLPPGQVRTIAGGIDTAAFGDIQTACPKLAKAHFGFPEDAFVLMHVALMAGRGHEEVLQALTRLGDTAPWLLWVGRGVREQRLREQVARAPRPIQDKVRFAGYLAGKELLEAYAAADAAFVAKPGKDASSRAALEAMACGLPLIVVRVGALNELPHTYPIHERSPEAIADAIRSLMHDREAARTRGRQAQSWVFQERSFEHEAEQTLQFYAQ